ncbi:hypothetical protein CBS9595_004076 [Malassezia furfur]|nr:hypothetical protein CBS9595_004076 [Malassezia furfur]
MANPRATDAAERAAVPPPAAARAPADGVLDGAAPPAAPTAAKKKKKKTKRAAAAPGAPAPEPDGLAPTLAATAQVQADLLATASDLYRRIEADPVGLPDDEAYWTSLPAHLRTFIRNALPLGHLAEPGANAHAVPRHASTQAMIAVAQQLAQAAQAAQRAPGAAPPSAYAAPPLALDPSVFVESPMLADLPLAPGAPHRPSPGMQAAAVPGENGFGSVVLVNELDDDDDPDDFPDAYASDDGADADAPAPRRKLRKKKKRTPSVPDAPPPPPPPPPPSVAPPSAPLKRAPAPPSARAAGKLPAALAPRPAAPPAAPAPRAPPKRAAPRAMFPARCAGAAPPASGSTLTIGSAEEREQIRAFWHALPAAQRRQLLDAEQGDVQRKLRDYTRHACACRVCQRKRAAMDAKLRALYASYYEALEAHSAQWAQHRAAPDAAAAPAGPGPFPGSIALDAHGGVVGAHLLLSRQPHAHGPHGAYARARRYDERRAPTPPTPDDDDLYDDEALDDEEDELDDALDDELDAELDARSERDVCRNADCYRINSSLTVKGILTVADDLSGNEVHKLLLMMEQLAERSLGAVAADDEAPEDAASLASDLELTPDEQREQGWRMFQIFAARILEHRVLHAYRERIAQERQRQLLRELEEEDANEKAREAKRAKENQRKKDKKRLLRQQKEEERARKEQERAAEEAAARAAQERQRQEELRRQEEQRRARDEERRRKDEELRRAREEERRRKDEELAERRRKEERRRKDEEQAERRRKEERRRKDEEQAERRRKEERDAERRRKDERRKHERKRDKDADAPKGPSAAPPASPAARPAPDAGRAASTPKPAPAGAHASPGPAAPRAPAAASPAPRAPAPAAHASPAPVAAPAAASPAPAAPAAARASPGATWASPSRLPPFARYDTPAAPTHPGAPFFDVHAATGALGRMHLESPLPTPPPPPSLEHPLARAMRPHVAPTTPGLAPHSRSPPRAVPPPIGPIERPRRTPPDAPPPPRPEGILGSAALGDDELVEPRTSRRAMPSVAPIQRFGAAPASYAYASPWSAPGTRTYAAAPPFAAAPPVSADLWPKPTPPAPTPSWDRTRLAFEQPGALDADAARLPHADPLAPIGPPPGAAPSGASASGAPHNPYAFRTPMRPTYSSGL